MKIYKYMQIMIGQNLDKRTYVLNDDTPHGSKHACNPYSTTSTDAPSSLPLFLSQFIELNIFY